MIINFKNNNGDECLLGSKSFGYLNENNIFDKYQEDEDQNSEIILLITKRENIMNLRQDILRLMSGRGIEIRMHLKKKISNLCKFLNVSHEIKCLLE